MGRATDLRGSGLRRGAIAFAVAVLLMGPCGTAAVDERPRWPLIPVAASPPPTPVPTATATSRLSGRVSYYANDQPLAGARVTLRGATTVRSVRTDAAGAFVVDGTRDESWQLAVDAGPPAGAAVSALDAALVLQTIAGGRRLGAGQRLACDVTGNGGLTALDAALLLQQAVGLLDAAPVAGTCAGPWLLLPAPAAAAGQRTVAPTVGTDHCAAGAIAYEPLAASATRQDFRALLFGDCSGNWRPPGAARRARNRHTAVYLRNPYQRGSGHWVVSLVVVSEAPFSALDVRLAYDPTRVAIDGVRSAGTASGATVAVRADAGGRLTVALAAAEPVIADHHVVSRIRMRADAPPALRIVAADLDESPVEP